MHEQFATLNGHHCKLVEHLYHLGTVAKVHSIVLDVVRRCHIDVEAGHCFGEHPRARKELDEHFSMLGQVSNLGQHTYHC